MPTKQELEQMDVIRLAVLCQKFADADSTDEAMAEKARQLKLEWVRLVARETPPPLTAKEHDQIQAEKQALKKRMVEFLKLV